MFPIGLCPKTINIALPDIWSHFLNKKKASGRECMGESVMGTPFAIVRESREHLR